jgi:DNA-binding NtrC family response regulator
MAYDCAFSTLRVGPQQQNEARKAVSYAVRKRILLVDDDPSHLDIYGMIVDRAGYHAVPLLVRFAGLEPVPDEEIDAILLDYRLNSLKTSPEIAQQLKEKHPQAPILVLSDLWTMPEDIQPYASEFVRKGEPEKLLNALRRLVTGHGSEVPYDQDR